MFSASWLINNLQKELSCSRYNQGYKDKLQNSLKIFQSILSLDIEIFMDNGTKTFCALVGEECGLVLMIDLSDGTLRIGERNVSILSSLSKNEIQNAVYTLWRNFKEKYTGKIKGNVYLTDRDASWFDLDTQKMGFMPVRGRLISACSLDG